MGGLTIDADSFVNKALAVWTAGVSATIESWLFVVFPFLNVPIVRNAIKWAIEWFVRKYSNKAEKAAFFANTKIRAADQAKDFESKFDAVDALPEDVSNEDWEKAEREKLAAFDQLMSWTK